MDLSERVQAYLHARFVTEHHERKDVPPFVVYLHNTDPGFDANFALPTMPLPAVSPAEINVMCGVFAAHERVPHVRFLDTLVPAFVDTLPTVGLHQINCAQIMICTPDTLARSPLPPDVNIVTLSTGSALGDVWEGLDVNEWGFDPHAPPTTDEAAAQFQQTLHDCRAFTLRYRRQGVSAGMFVPVHDGVTEVAGIATLAPFRRRGFAGMVTAYITRAAFDHGADVVFLRGASGHAERVYERVGFRAHGALRTYRLQQPP